MARNDFQNEDYSGESQWNIPYIARGFRIDAQRLLEKFEAMKSLKFTDFAQLWREVKFSLIFMGRTNLRDLKAFIEECYRNTLMFLNLHRPYIKVGAIYLLYSLYLKQPLLILRTPVKIMITVQDIEEIQRFQSSIMEGDYGEYYWEFYYVATKLFKMEAFHISYSPIILGPMVPYSILAIDPIRKSEFLNSLENLSLVRETYVKDTTSKLEKYQQQRRAFPKYTYGDFNSDDVEKLKNLDRDIEKVKQRYDSGLLLSESPIKLKSEFSLGNRRAKLKAQSFEMAAGGMNRFRTVLSEDIVDESIANGVQHIKKSPVKRKRGRPRKRASGISNGEGNDLMIDERNAQDDGAEEMDSSMNEISDPYFEIKVKKETRGPKIAASTTGAVNDRFGHNRISKRGRKPRKWTVTCAPICEEGGPNLDVAKQTREMVNPEILDDTQGILFGAEVDDPTFVEEAEPNPDVKCLSPNNVKIIRPRPKRRHYYEEER